MARYIDADALIERILKLKVVTDDMYGMGIARGIERAETAIQMQPTADVVPKSEVAREIFDEVDEIFNDYKLAERGLRLIQHGESSIDQRYAELKKKYTEEKE